MRRFSKIAFVLIIAVLGIVLSGCESPNPPPRETALTPEVQATIDLANEASSFGMRNDILYSGIKYCKNKDDIFALASEHKNTTSSQVQPSDILKAGKEFYKTIDDVIAAAKLAETFAERDEILCFGEQFISSPADAIKLSNETKTLKSNDQILLNAVELCKTHKDIIALANETKIAKNDNKILYCGIELCKTHADVLELKKAATGSIAKNKLVTEGLKVIEANAFGETTNTDPDAEQDAQNNSNDLMKAQAAMLEAQLAYVNAASAGEPQDKILELNKIYMEKKKAYEALGGS